jgi:predicted ATPase
MRLILENFKSVGAQTEIELSPVTLLVGANGTGKSTIIHALHFLRHLLLGRDPNESVSVRGRSGPSLGSFADLVHGRDSSKTMTLGLEAELPPLEWYNVYSQRRLIRKAIRTLSVTIAVTDRLGVFPWIVAEIQYVEIKINGEFLAVLGSPPPSYEAMLPKETRTPVRSDDIRFPHQGRLLINGGHPVLAEHPPAARAWLDVDPKTSKFTIRKNHAAEEDPNWFVDLCRKALGEGVPLDDGLVWMHASVLPFAKREHFRPGVPVKVIWPKDREQTDEEMRDRYLISNTLFELICKPIRLLRKTWLDQFAHIGPLRMIPPDSVLLPGGSLDNKHDWFDGSAAWSRLAKPRSDAADDVNAVLAEPSWMDTGVSVESCTFKQFLHLRDRNDGSILKPDDLAGPDNDTANGADEKNGPVEDFINTTLERSNMLEKSELTERFMQLLKLLRSQATVQRVVFRDIETQAEIKPRQLATGLCQVIPVLVALLDKRLPFIAVEQPELHLHPKLCGDLADVLVYGATWARPGSAAETGNDRSEPSPRFMIIETHSEHLVRRLMQRVREAEAGEASRRWAKKFTADSLCIIYTEPSASGGPRMRRLKVNAQGEFADGWPDGFFDVK